MNMIWLCITSVLSLTSIISGQHIDTRHIRVFPAANQSIAGVFQVSSLNAHSQPHYAFNASEARRLCLSIGVTIASKAQVQQALSRGLETCRFGWIDEHLAVIPRIKALSNCGNNQTGVVTWRAPVKKQFDVFCFNESDAATQLKDTTTDSTDYYSEQTTASTQAANSTSSSHHHHHHHHPSSSAPTNIDTEEKAALYVGSAHSSVGGKAVVITSTCALLLIAIIIIVYLKLKKICTQGFDVEKQQESIETEDWTCVKNVKQNQEDVQDDEKIEVDENESDVTE